MEYQLEPGKDLAVQIADQIKSAILRADLLVNARLPSEAELAERFEVSRPTVREALKRLAAQNLIRTQRGATGGAFVNRLSFAEAAAQQETTATLVLSMNAVDFETACEARFALERACAPLAAARRSEGHLAQMAAEIARQADPQLPDVDFCSSDVAFHRLLVSATDNPVLGYQLAGAVEGMQPLMNMITYTARSRASIVALHEAILEGLRLRQAGAVEQALSDLATYTAELGSQMRAKRASR